MNGIRFAVLLSFTVLFMGAYGCGSSDSSAGSNAGAGGSASGAGGAQSCGTANCGATQYCVIPCCGGTALPCFQPPDGGTCPTGSTTGCLGASFMCSDPASCCQPEPCVPPPPYCSDTVPSGCITEQGKTCRLTCA
jgi:hypothetical protein